MSMEGFLAEQPHKAWLGEEGTHVATRGAVPSLGVMRRSNGDPGDDVVSH